MSITVSKPAIAAPVSGSIGKSVAIAGKHDYSVTNGTGSTAHVSVVGKLWIQFAGTPSNQQSDSYDLETEAEGSVNTSIDWKPTAAGNYIIVASTKVQLGTESDEKQSDRLINVS